MAEISSKIFTGKGTRKTLTLELSEGEDVFECIKEGMAQNKISKASVESIEGGIKDGFVNYFARGKYISHDIKMANVEKAYGTYDLKGNNALYGNLHIVISSSV